MQAVHLFFVFSILISLALIQAEDQGEVKPKVNEEVKGEVADVNGEIQSEVKAEKQNEVQDKPQVEVESKSQVEVEGKPQVEIEGKPQVEVEGESQVDVEGEPQVEVEGEPQFGILGSCSNPESYSGQSLCYPAGQFCGECVSFVKVCTKDYRTTQNWVRGTKVRGASISKGTAIATFSNGIYSEHAAIYISQNGDGIQVWDQWKGHPVSQRTIYWNGSELRNNGDSYYVIN